MSTPEARLLAIDLDRTSKAVMVRLCRDLGMPSGGLKATLETALRAKAATLQPASSSSGTSTSTSTTTSPATAPTATSALTTSTLPAAPSSGLQHHPHLQAIAQRAAQQAIAQALGAYQLPPALPLTLHPLATTTLSPYYTTAIPAAPQIHPLPLPLPSALATAQLPPNPYQRLPITAPAPAPLPLGSVHPTAATGLTLPTAPAPLLPGSGTVHSATAALIFPTAAPGTAAYQPPTASPAELQAWQSQLATAAPAPFSTGIPPLPARLQARLLAGEFIDFSDILHAIEVDNKEEQPVSLEVGEGHQLTLSRKRKRREISDFQTWSQCFSVYAAVLTAVQPARGPDLCGYHYIIATASKEYSSSAFLAYDIAFRKKAAQFRLSRWGEIDPHIYTKAFTGTRRSTNQCSLCTSMFHRIEDCDLYTGGPVRKARTTQPGPRSRSAVPTHRGKEVCLNWNRGKCSRDHDCPRAHVCSVQAYQGPHRAFACPSRRSSPRKA